MPAVAAPPLHRTSVDSPLRRILIACSDAGLAVLSLPGEDEAAFARRVARHAPTRSVGAQAARHAAQLAEELTAYFAGTLRRFSVPLAPRGTAFQHEVWDAVCAVPYGETATYGEIAAGLNRPRAARAVGHANGANPLPIVIPCHRVMAAEGRLGGYSGGRGTATKLKLLTFEGALLV